MKRKALTSGFTLIELLVVIAILGFLAAVLFPVFAHVRESARQTACLSNLRHLGIAVTQYAQESNGYLPAYNNHQDPNAVLAKKSWPDQGAKLVTSLRPYTGTNEIWFCPSDPYARIGGSPIPVNASYINHRYSSYLFAYFHYDPSPIRLLPLQPPHPENAELNYALFWGNSWGCKANDDSINVSLYSHNGMFNAVMFDGHIRSYRWDDPTCIGTGDGDYQ